MLAVATPASVCAGCGAIIDSSVLADENTCSACLLRLGLAVTAHDNRNDLVGATPDHIGPYLIARRDDGSPWVLGRGAMGITFRAIDKSLQRPVALKIINTNIETRSAEARERFAREARAAASLRHPNVATVYQFGVREETGQFFYAMELIEGETLEERVRRLGPIDVSIALEIALQVAAALEAAEQQGLVHRDLKPGNLMLVSQGSGLVSIDSRTGQRTHRAPCTECPVTVKVIDFGVAKAVAEKTYAMSLTHGGFIGTPAFASPEQFTNAPVDVRSDIYSLGATLWLALTGKLLFSGRTVEELRAARESKPLPIEQLKTARVPRRFIALLRSMLALEPAARPAGARQVATALNTIRDSISRRGKVVVRSVIAAVIIVITIAAAWKINRSLTATMSSVPEKSIAVLPFQSFSDGGDNGYLADGVQDEILTDLTKVVDLKVIGRRTVAQFRDTKQSAREIGEALQVRYLLEGTVRKHATHIYVTTQLIDTRSGSQRWAEKYERELADIFLIQNDIAQEVVAQLKAELSPREKEAIERKPTADMEAYDLYLRARSLVYRNDVKSTKADEDDAKKASEFLEAAIARDPNFTLAYCALAEAQFYFQGGASLQQSWRNKAKHAIDVAMRISPDSAEVHLVRAHYFIDALDDADAGEKDLAIAAAGLPGRAAVLALRAAMEEQRGQWKEAVRDREREFDLDPRGAESARDLIDLYLALRWYSRAERLADHMIAVLPKYSAAVFWRLKSHIALARGDVAAAMTAFDSNPMRDEGLPALQHMLADLFIMQRNYPQATNIFEAMARPVTPYAMPKAAEAGMQVFGRGMALERLGRIARFRGEKESARNYFEAARQCFREWLVQNSGQTQWLTSHIPALIAEVDAGLGREEATVREGLKQIESSGLQSDARIAPNVKIYLAIAYMWSGQRDAALQQLSDATKMPIWRPGPGHRWPVIPGLSAGELKLNPLWDELRAEPRFQQLIAEAAKPVTFD